MERVVAFRVQTGLDAEVAGAVGTFFAGLEADRAQIFLGRLRVANLARPDGGRVYRFDEGFSIEALDFNAFRQVEEHLIARSCWYPDPIFICLHCQGIGRHCDPMLGRDDDDDRSTAPDGNTDPECRERAASISHM